MHADSIGRALVLFGIILAGLGLLFILAGRLAFFGRLPGDISFRWGGGSFFFPIVTCLVLSAVLSVVLNVVLRILNRS
jgi:hypothetical protein